MMLISTVGARSEGEADKYGGDVDGENDEDDDIRVRGCEGGSTTKSTFKELLYERRCTRGRLKIQVE